MISHLEWANETCFYVTIFYEKYGTYLSKLIKDEININKIPFILICAIKK